MTTAWNIGKVAGIQIRLHFTFLVLLVWVGLSHYLQHGRVPDALAGLAFMLALFTIVVLHELGHALMARRFGIATADITLLPIGGVARLERMPDRPRQELLVALAGPAVNVVLATLLFLVLRLTAQLPQVWDARSIDSNFLAKLMMVNISLAVFNLLPAFPMDGGRVLRALLAMRMDYAKATGIAARIGQGMAALFGFIGLFSNPILMLIAVFVWVGAKEESEQARIKSALSGLTVDRVMLTDFRVLAPDDPLAYPVKLVLSGSQQDFPVVEEGLVVGILTRASLLDGLSQSGESGQVREVMQRQFLTAHPTDRVESLLERLGQVECRVLPVAAAGRLVGIFTPENLGEYLMVRAALGGRKGGSTAVPPTIPVRHEG